MNGPKPVCTLAMKKLNQSSPWRLLDEGAGARSAAASLASYASLQSMVRHVSPVTRTPTPASLVRLVASGARCRRHPAPRQAFSRRTQVPPSPDLASSPGSLRSASRWGEMQRVRIDGDLPAAHAEEAPEVDDGGARLARAVHDHVHDAPHVLSSDAAYFLAD